MHHREHREMKSSFSVTSVVSLFLLLAAPAQADDTLSGRDIYEGRCAGVCHQSPPQHAFKEKQWRVVLGTMQKRMRAQGQPPLSEAETEALLAWLLAEKPQ